MWQIIANNHTQEKISWIQNSLGLIELCKWRRNKEKLKKYVVDDNPYYNKNRDEDEEEYYETKVTDKNDYYESNDEQINKVVIAL